MRAEETERGDDNRYAVRLLKVLAVIASVGAINLGLVGFFNYNLIDALFGGGAIEHTTSMSRVLYAMVGIAGVGVLLLLPTTRRSAIGPEETGSPRGFIR